MSAPHVTLRPATLADLDAFEQRFDSAEGAGPYLSLLRDERRRERVRTR